MASAALVVAVVAATLVQGAAAAAAQPASGVKLPGAPTIGVATAGDEEATVSWTAPASNGGSPITGYRVTPFIGLFPLPSTTFSSTATTQVVTGLVNGIPYRFRVRAINAVGVGHPSGLSNSVTPTGPTVPGAPTIGVATAGDEEATVSWTAPASNGGSPITGYRVTPFIGLFPLPSTTFSSTGTTQVVTGLVNGISYRFWVRAINAVGVGHPSKRSNAVTPVAPTAVAPAVAAGSSSACALKPDGTVWCWGGGLGPLGGNLPTMVPGISDATAISSGSEHTCARLDDGTVRCWGVNFSGQLGDGTTTNSFGSPVTVLGITNATDVAAGGANTCARLADGSARCWGRNTFGQLGDGTTTDASTPVTVPGLSAVASLAVSGGHICARSTAGTVLCWGRNDVGQVGNGTVGGIVPAPVPVAGLVDATTIAAGSSHTCAALASGPTRCWGRNDLGQLGDGTDTDAPTPVTTLGVTDVAALAAGPLHTCAVLADGTARCWGSEQRARLGNDVGSGSTSDPWSTAVTVIGLTDAADIAAGEEHTCVVLTDGAARCWGINEFGQHGNGAVVGYESPVDVVDLAGAVGVSAGDFHSCALVTDGTARCWGSNASGQLGNSTIGVNSPSPVPVIGLTTAAEIAAGGFHTCARLLDGTVRCWGAGYTGLATITGITTATAITASTSRACARLADGSVSCWSVGSTSPVPVAGITTATAVSAGEQHTCAVLADGTLRCWGDNAFGQLGDGTSGTFSSTPVTVVGIADATAVAAGHEHTCALLADGTARCWGLGNWLGAGLLSITPSPVPVTGIVDATTISAAAAHSCVTLTDGTARCWGSDEHGRLGDGPGGAAGSVPVTVVGISDATAIDVGDNEAIGGHSCALLADGSVRCWGYNFFGQVGTGTAAISGIPVPVSL